MQYRQGDVFLQKVKTVPKAAKQIPGKSGKLILAEGEATGHAHAVSELDGSLFIDAAGGMFLRTDRGCELVHQEHAPIGIDPGIYKVTRQQEYTPEEIRNVAD